MTEITHMKTIFNSLGREAVYETKMLCNHLPYENISDMTDSIRTKMKEHFDDRVTTHLTWSRIGDNSYVLVKISAEGRQIVLVALPMDRKDFERYLERLVERASPHVRPSRCPKCGQVVEQKPCCEAI